jgi:hypothetical protein
MAAWRDSAVQQQSSRARLPGVAVQVAQVLASGAYSLSEEEIKQLLIQFEVSAP